MVQLWHYIISFLFIISPSNIVSPVCSPYMSADLEKMAAAFNTTISALEDELMALILDGQIQARIDSHNKVQEAYQPHNRTLQKVYLGYVIHCPHFSF